MSTLNLGILAHVDAGKTSLTERLLYAAGVIDRIGRVDDGDTRTDSLALERRRGITIKSAVVSFTLGDITVNLIDTPGHPDFIAEVERVLSVLDGAVLVVSAVEGVQAQTRVLMRTLRRLGIPTLIFVNKIDRTGARHDDLLRELAAKLTPAVVPMGTVRRPGTRDAAFLPYGATDPAFAPTGPVAERLAEQDDAFLAAYVENPARLTYGRLRRELAARTRQALIHPVFSGSAISGAGVDTLTRGIREFLPATADDERGPAAGTVFKVERGPAGEKIAYVRMFSGALRVRDRLPAGDGDGDTGRITAIGVFEDGGTVRRASVGAGRIGTLRGLGGIRIGDVIGDPAAAPAARRHFSPPTLETVVVPGEGTDTGALHTALTQLAEQDPLINLRQDEIRRELSVSLYGEVQKEVIQATLADEYGVDVTFRETTTICVERLTGTGNAVEVMGKEPNPFLATVGLRVGPAAPGSGVGFTLEVELGSMPYAFMKAIEDTVRATLNEGLYGWAVPDCAVVLTRCGYAPRQSHAHGTFDKSMSSTGGDFRLLTPLVLMAALKDAGTVVCEPMHHFRLDVPADTFGTVLPALARRRAVPHTPSAHGRSYVVEGEIPAAEIHALEQQLPALTGGEGALEASFAHHRPVVGDFPTRARTDHDPLNRKEYLLGVVRRVPTGAPDTRRPPGADPRHG
ncbi:TetM/TetW/TetO/TetS family tetracycline resistance ribosomal protection protein [Streptomyces sp. NBC_01498]|uniref:translation factor GTPase family protein n=1 Tax=Streptomyces sp. NBC_01498 TaxID=2975870 RepID=UPI002E7B9BBF|nr:translation factor GTPase family protein [Streptomyces sp. NBC_01498]WTL27490.1 TetM/TetW/TetO/TetS family tetracycline resistance ribosomal protection protein [Streptomyces sp. NBC_01498]